MIKIVHARPGFYAPMLYCDYCKKRITDAGSAAAITVSHPMPEGASSDVLHVHKGDCHDAVEKKLGGTAGWEELSRHIMQLNYNVDLSPEKLQAHRDADAEGIGMFRYPDEKEE
jgi:hypothetical protein